MSANAFPLVAYDNLVEDATLTASTEDGDYPKENLADKRAFELWKGTGSAEQYVRVELDSGGLDDGFDDLDAWTETDPNGTLAIDSGKLSYDSGANSDDSPKISHDSLSVAAPFVLELVFDITAWPTATETSIYFDIDFQDGNNGVRFTVSESSGNAWVLFSDKVGAGSYTLQDNYTCGGASGRLYLAVDAAGNAVAKVYDDDDSAYHDLHTTAGGSAYQVTELDKLELSFSLGGRTAGSWTAEFEHLHHAIDNDVTFWGVSGHDIYTQGASIRLDASVGGVGYDTVESAITPTDDKTFGKIVTSGVYKYYKVVIPTGYTSPPYLGVVYLGGYFQFPNWHSGDFDPYRREIRSASNTSRTGQLLGTTVSYQERRVSLNFDSLTSTWVDANLPDFWEGILGGTCFFAWDITNHEDDVWYLEPAPNQDYSAPYSGNSRSFSIELRGPVE